MVEITLIKTVGWLGSFCLAICGIPQAFKSYKQGHSKGVSSLFVWLWFIGESSYLIYIPMQLGWDLPVMFNIIFNFLCCLVILKFIYFPIERVNFG